MLSTVTNVSFSLPVLVAIPVALITLYYLLGALLDPLRDVQGPTLSRYTRLWELYKNWQGQFEHVTIALHKQYGNLVHPICMIVLY